MSAAYCMACVHQTHPLMLTTYCLWNHTCGRCGNLSDCALVLPRGDEMSKCPHCKAFTTGNPCGNCGGQK